MQEKPWVAGYSLARSLGIARQTLERAALRGEVRYQSALGVVRFHAEDARSVFGARRASPSCATGSPGPS